MATYKPGRLRRTLTPIIGTGSLFTFYTPELGVYENEITEVTVTRGTSGRNVGHHPNVLEVGLTGRRDTLVTGSQCRLFMREQQAADLAAFIGGATGSDIAFRFNGRLGAISIEDTGKRYSTTVAANSWLTQMNWSPAGMVPFAGQNIGSLLLALTHASEAPRGITFGTMLGDVNIVHFADGEYTLFKDGIGDLAEDIGVQIQERRDGTTLAWGHDARISLAASRAISEFPLMKNQAIAPARYEQPNERPAKRIEYKLYNATGGVATRSAEISNPTGELRETEQIDWTRWQSLGAGDQLYREALARVHESSARRYTVPTITVDILMLLRNGSSYARRIARQMLLLEVGEPVMFSGDWPAKLRGVHFAEGIKETITKDEWQIELSLVPHVVAVGATTPNVQPRAWDSFAYDWNTETRKWDEA